jgi:hypothetical protein
MFATARLTGQTIGAILAAISFRMAGHSEMIALTVAAVQHSRGDRDLIR